MLRSFTLDGKRHRIPSDLPVTQINWIVGNVHVGSSDAEVRSDIGRRAEGAGWDMRLTRAAQLYAVHCHRKNQKLYRYVMGGA